MRAREVTHHHVRMDGATLRKRGKDREDRHASGDLLPTRCPPFPRAMLPAPRRHACLCGQVDYVKGWGKLSSANDVSVTLSDGSGNQTISAKNIVMAVGSEVRSHRSRAPHTHTTHALTLGTTHARAHPFSATATAHMRRLSRPPRSLSLS